MDVAEVYVRSPPIKAEPRWSREDTMDRNPMNDGYRRRSPGKQELRSNVMLIYPSPYIKLLIPSSTSTCSILLFLFNSAPLRSHTDTRAEPFPVGILSELSAALLRPPRGVEVSQNMKRKT